MKRIIIIEVILLCIFAIFIAINTYLWRSISYLIDVLKSYDEPTLANSLNIELSYGISALFGCLFTLITIILIAIKDFPCFKPLLDKLNAHKQARKEKRTQAKAECAEAEKQQRIEQLQAELEELKKD